jgi:inner membrane protein
MPSTFDRLNNWARKSVTLKLFVIGLLILLLLIPASMLQSLIRERESLRNTAIEEVSAKWGLAQTIGGPVISVPYTTSTVDREGKTVSRSGYAHFLPDEIIIDGEVTPEERYRGIYVVVLYQTTLHLSGHFGTLNAAALQVPEQDLRWEDARFTVGISDMAGVQDAIPVTLNDTTYQLGPGTVTNDIFTAGASVPIQLKPRADRLDFDFDLRLNGSSALSFLPFGKETRVSLTSPWTHPSFEGAFLPDDRTVGDQGFTASWKVLQLNRNYPQQGEGAYIGKADSKLVLHRTDYSVASPAYNTASKDPNAFGLRLLLPIDEYHKSMRTAKYSALFIFITFLTFFFIEVLNRKRLHPIQYLLIGAAVILFYVLLVSIAEHLNFDSAYWISCALIMVLITGYSVFVLRNRKLTILVAGMLFVLYGFFYSILQLQDYALLLGSLGLLLMLASIMYLTRNIDWYKLNQGVE